MVLAIDESTFDEFKVAWLEEIESEKSTTAKGRAFARKLASDWLEVDPDSDEFHHIDGSGDLGIDIAYLYEGKSESDDESDEQNVGDTWYLFQCKYGTAGLGVGMVRDELRKMFDAITGSSTASVVAATTLVKLRNFVQHQGEPKDRVVLIIGTVDSLTAQQLKALDETRAEFAGKLRERGPTLEVVPVSVQSVHEAILRRPEKSVDVALAGKFSPMDETGNDEDAWIGTVSIKSMYDMLLEYRKLTGDLDQIYDKNVRRWLGMGHQRKVNFGIRNTIENTPNKLGIYNNGVTLVCSEFKLRKRRGRGTTYHLVNPYVVNGCQTTRTLFEVVDGVLGAGGGRQREPLYGSCYFVVKVVETDDPDRLTDITRFTNTQNAVRESDLIATDQHYNKWKIEMEQRHGLYLEIQRGGWESRRAHERERPTLTPRLTENGARPVKANDVIKVYGAGWLGRAGTAARRNTDFLPGPDPENGGSVFKQISGLSAKGRFGADDLKASHLVYWAGKDLGFAARGSGIQRAMTRYLFYYAFIELVREIGCEHGRPSDVPADEVTRMVLALAKNEAHFNEVAKAAARAITAYTTAGNSSDPPYMADKAFKDVGSWEGIVKSHRADAINIPDEMPKLRSCINAQIDALKIDTGHGASFESFRKTVLGEG